MNVAMLQSPTALLLAWGNRDEAAFDELLPLIHGELRRIGRAQGSTAPL